MNSIKKITNYVFDRYKVTDKVAFFINEEYIFDHYSSVMEGLDSNIFDIVLEDKFKQKKYESLINKLTLNSWSVLFLSDVLYLRKYKVLLTHLYLGGSTASSGTMLLRVKLIIFKLMKVIGIIWLKEPPKQYFQNILGVSNIRFMYGADAGGVKFGKYNYLFDEFFCHGPRDSGIIRKKFDRPVYEMGYPRYDSYFDKLNDKGLRCNLLKKYLCNHKKPTILWICTVSEYFSTIEKYEGLMYKFTKKYNVILRPHPMEIDPQYRRYKKNVHDIVNSGQFIISSDPYQEMFDLYLIADFVFCDYGGSIFSALYVNKKIVLMDHEFVSMDFEVYQSTSMEVRKYLPTIREIEGCDIDKKLLDSGFWNNGSENKKKARREYFGSHEGNSAKNTAVRIMEILSYE